MKRFIGGMLVASVMALAVVATALAIPPERFDATVGPSVIPAGVACAFAVRREPHNNSATLTFFSDGRVQLIARAQVTLTDVSSGVSILWESHFTSTLTPGVDGGDDSFVTTGRFNKVVFEGEPTGLGGVGPAFLGVIGHETAAFDPATGSMTSASIEGQAVDLCAVLAEGGNP